MKINPLDRWCARVARLTPPNLSQTNNPMNTHNNRHTIPLNPEGIQVIEPELRPCPVCGREPNGARNPEQLDIRCESTQHTVRVTAMTRAQAVALWNGPDPWRPISEAPKTKECVMVWSAKFGQVRAWYASHYRCYVSFLGRLLMRDVTHFQPLPPGPREKGTK